MTTTAPILLRDFHPKSLLVHEEHIPERAMFPVVDAHNHLFGAATPEALLEVMDAVGVAVWVGVAVDVGLAVGVGVRVGLGMGRGVRVAVGGTRRALTSEHPARRGSTSMSNAIEPSSLRRSAGWVNMRLTRIPRRQATLCTSWAEIIAPLCAVSRIAALRASPNRCAIWRRGLRMTESTVRHSVSARSLRVRFGLGPKVCGQHG